MTNKPHEMLPPAAQVLQMLMGKVISQSVSTAAKLSIADHLAEGPLGIAELAERVSGKPAPLLALMRALASIGVFAEVADSRFANTPLSDVLRARGPESMRSMALFLGEEPTWRATGDLEHTIRTGQSAFHKIYGEHPYEYFGKRVRECPYYDEAFTNFSNQETDAILQAASFADAGTIVDVGGGHGTTLSKILQRNPRQHGVLFDQRHVVERAGYVLDSAGVADRCKIVAGNFFDAVPPGGDAYLIKHVLFNWDDETAVRILRAVRRAASPTSRLFVIDPVLDGGPGQSFEKFMGVEMMVVHDGGRQRTQAEFAQLLASGGFTLVRVVATHAPSSVIEAVPAH